MSISKRTVMTLTSDYKDVLKYGVKKDGTKTQPMLILELLEAAPGNSLTLGELSAQLEAVMPVGKQSPATVLYYYVREFDSKGGVTLLTPEKEPKAKKERTPRKKKQRDDEATPVQEGDGDEAFAA